MEIMIVRVKLNSVILPLLTLGMLMMQLINPSKIWQAMIVAFGGLEDGVARLFVVRHTHLDAEQIVFAGPS